MSRELHKHGLEPDAIKGFDEHATCKTARLKPARHGGGDGRRALSGFATRRYRMVPETLHFRMTARTMALPGNHVRAVARPLKATHCKADG